MLATTNKIVKAADGIEEKKFETSYALRLGQLITEINMQIFWRPFLRFLLNEVYIFRIQECSYNCETQILAGYVEYTYFFLILSSKAGHIA